MIRDHASKRWLHHGRWLRDLARLLFPIKKNPAVGRARVRPDDDGHLYVRFN